MMQPDIDPKRIGAIWYQLNEVCLAIGLHEATVQERFTLIDNAVRTKTLFNIKCLGFHLCF